MDNHNKDAFIKFLEIVKLDLIQLVARQVDNVNGMIFFNGMISGINKSQAEITKTKSKDQIRPNNGLSKKQ